MLSVRIHRRTVNTRYNRSCSLVAGEFIRYHLLFHSGFRIHISPFTLSPYHGILKFCNENNS